MLWAVAADFWWVVPVAVSAAGVTALGVRRVRAGRGGRRLAYDAARAGLAAAKQEAGVRRAELRVVRAEHAHRLAERASAGSTDIVGIRRQIRQAEKAVKASDAAVRAEKARVAAARAELAVTREPQQYPLAKLEAAHAAVTARWLEYETDPAKAIAFPTMSDVREPLTAAFLVAAQHARQARPAPRAPVTAEMYAMYRDAVADLERAFDTAERAARARAGMSDAAERPAWQDAAHQVITLSAEAIDRAAEVAASALVAWNKRGRDDEPRP